MYRSLICLVAEGVIRDVGTNNISVFNILEGITAEGFPLFVPHITFFAFLERDTGDDERLACRFAVTQNTVQLKDEAFEIHFQGQVRDRVIITLRGLLIPQPGILVFSLVRPTGAIASYSLEVKAVSSARTESTPSPQA